MLERSISRIYVTSHDTYTRMRTQILKRPPKWRLVVLAGCLLAASHPESAVKNDDQSHVDEQNQWDTELVQDSAHQHYKSTRT